MSASPRDRNHAQQRGVLAPSWDEIAGRVEDSKHRTADDPLAQEIGGFRRNDISLQERELVIVRCDGTCCEGVCVHKRFDADGAGLGERQLPLGRLLESLRDGRLDDPRRFIGVRKRGQATLPIRKEILVAGSLWLR